MEEQEEVQKGHAVRVHILCDSAVLPLLGGVISEERPCSRLVHAGYSHEGIYVHFVAEIHAVHNGDIRQARNASDLRTGLQFPEESLFRGIVPPGNQYRHRVAAAKGLRDLGLSSLHLGLTEGGDHVQAVSIAGMAENEIRADYQQHKQHRDDVPCGVSQLSDCGDFGDKALVPGLIHSLAEQHQQAGHKEEHRQQAADDGLDERQAHIRTEPELHQGHGGKAGNSGQAAG